MSAVFGSEADATAERLQRDWSRRLLFDPRPLGGEPETGFRPQATIIESPPAAANAPTTKQERRIEHERFNRELLQAQERERQRLERELERERERQKRELERQLRPRP